MSRMETITITENAKIENIPVMTDRADALMKDMSVPAKTAVQIDIAIDEILSNICKFAYPDGEGSMTIHMSVDETAGIIELTFEDSGVPFDPLEAAVPDVTAGLAERKIGGLGIYMVRKSMDCVEYEYSGGSNMFTIKKNFV